MVGPRGRLTLTIAIAAVTAVAWFGLVLSRYDQIADLLGGFIPARFGAHPPFLGGVPPLLTPLTATLLHGSALHLGFNMLMLLFCGREVERAVGAGGLAVLYLVGAYAAALGEYLWHPGSLNPMIGASGAISAVVAAYAMLYSKRNVRAVGPISPILVHALWLAAAWIGVQALISVATSHSGMPVAVAAHVGGFLVGLPLARPLLAWRYRSA